MHRISVLKTIVVMYCLSERQILLLELKLSLFIEKPSGIGLQTSIPTFIQSIFPAAWELIGKNLLTKPIGNPDTHGELQGLSKNGNPGLCGHPTGWPPQKPESDTKSQTTAYP